MRWPTHVRSYTIHWRQLVAVWTPSALVFLYLRWIRGDLNAGVNWWAIFNMWMVLVLLLSIRREQRGLGDEWPEEWNGAVRSATPGPRPLPVFPLSLNVSTRVAQFLRPKMFSAHDLYIDRSQSGRWIIHCSEQGAAKVIEQLEAIRGQVKDRKLRRHCDEALVSALRAVDAHRVLTLGN